MKKRSPLFLVLLAGIALVGTSSTRAEETPVSEDDAAMSAVDEGEETIDANDEFAGDETMAVADVAATQSCVNNICVGMYVQVTSGNFVGQAGAVVGIDDGNATATVVNAVGEYVYPLLSDLTAQNSMNWDGCFANVCIGDKVKLLSGPYARKKGRVAGLNPANATATVLVKRKFYVTIAISELKVKNHVTYSEPYPTRVYYRHYRTCGYDSVFDAYRGCVRVIRIYHPIPRRVVIVRPGHAPRHRRPPSRPVIIRPANPRGPTTPGRPSRPGKPTPSRPSRPSNPTPSRPSRPSNPAPSRPSRPSNPAPSRPSPSKPSPSKPSRPAHPHH